MTPPFYHDATEGYIAPSKDPPSDLRRRLELTWGAVNWFVGPSAVAFLAMWLAYQFTEDSAAQHLTKCSRTKGVRWLLYVPVRVLRKGG